MLPLWAKGYRSDDGEPLGFILFWSALSVDAWILAKLAKETGLPSGELNIIYGSLLLLTKSPQLVGFCRKYVMHPRSKPYRLLKGITGKYFHARGSANGKGIQGSHGAKNHDVILPDCDEAHAINAIIGVAYGASGQRCMAISFAIFCVGTTQTQVLDMFSLIICFPKWAKLNAQSSSW